MHPWKLRLITFTTWGQWGIIKILFNIIQQISGIWYYCPLIGRTDAEAPILWPPDAKSWLIRKVPDAGKDWRQEEKGTTEDDGWMASLTWWIWIWASSWSWWWTGKPGMLQFMGLQRDRHYLTEVNGRKQTGTKEPIDKVKDESENSGLKLNIQKTNIIASGPITSW